MSYPFPLPVKGLRAKDQEGTVPDLKSLGVTHGGSIPPPGTNQIKELQSGMGLALLPLGNNVAGLCNTLLVGDTGPLHIGPAVAAAYPVHVSA